MRFNLDKISTVDIKYMEDDREWVLLTCNADLEEYMEIYKSSRGRTNLNLFNELLIQIKGVHLAAAVHPGATSNACIAVFLERVWLIIWSKYQNQLFVK